MSKYLRCYYQNTRGLRGRIKRGIKVKFSEANYDCIALTESWLNKNINSNELFDGDIYNVFRADRTAEKYNILKSKQTNIPTDDDILGGGCVVALRRNLSAVRMTNWESEIPFDNIWLKLNTTGNTNIFIHNIYLPGWTSSDHMKQYFNHLFDIINIREPYARYILLGDFNFSCINWSPLNDHYIPIYNEGGLANGLINTFTATNLKQYNPIKNKFNRILDLIVSNFKVHVTRAKNIAEEDDYHPALNFKFDKSDLKFIKQKSTIKPNFFKTNYEHLSNELANIDWYGLLNHSNVETAIESFYNLIIPLLTKHTPKIKPNNSKYPKWYSLNLIQMIKDKAYYRKKMKCNNLQSPIFSQLFTSKRREIKLEQKRCLKAYEKNIESLVSKKFFCIYKII